MIVSSNTLCRMINEAFEELYDNVPDADVVDPAKPYDKLYKNTGRYRQLISSISDLIYDCGLFEICAWGRFSITKDEADEILLMCKLIAQHIADSHYEFEMKDNTLIILEAILKSRELGAISGDDWGYITSISNLVRGLVMKYQCHQEPTYADISHTFWKVV